MNGGLKNMKENTQEVKNSAVYFCVLLPATYINFSPFNFRLRDMYKRLDDKYIKPCLLRENHVRDPKIIETYENLTERDALGKRDHTIKI